MPVWEEYLRPAAFIFAPFPGAFVGSYITKNNIKTWYDKVRESQE